MSFMKIRMTMEKIFPFLYDEKRHMYQPGLPAYDLIANSRINPSMEMTASRKRKSDGKGLDCRLQRTESFPKALYSYLGNGEKIGKQKSPAIFKRITGLFCFVSNP